MNKLSVEEKAKLFRAYEAELSGQMIKAPGKSIIRMISMGACAILGMSSH